MRTPVRIVCTAFALASLLGATGCSSDDDGGSSPTTTAATATTVDGDAPATSAAAPGSTATSEPDAPPPADCAPFTEAVGQLAVNWQIIVDLTMSTDVSAWPAPGSEYGTLADFDAQLDTIEAKVGERAAAADAIEFMRGADAIVQRGIGGDAGAAADLVDYLGTDAAASVARRNPVLQAASGVGC